MTGKQPITPLERSTPEFRDPIEHWLNDCWLVEVMPPTWAWAYRRLLNGNEAGARYTNRLA